MTVMSGTPSSTPSFTASISEEEEKASSKKSDIVEEEKVEKVGEPFPKEPWIDKAEKKPPPQSDNDPSVKNKNKERNPVSEKGFNLSTLIAEMSSFNMQTHSIGSFILRRKQSNPALPGGPNTKIIAHAGQPFLPDAPAENLSPFSPEAEVTHHSEQSPCTLTMVLK